MKGVVGMVCFAIAMAAASTALAGSNSATIGADLPFDVEGFYGKRTCSIDPFCIYVQDKIQGGTARAPFDGRIRNWRITEPNGTFRLVVARKLDSDSWKVVRWGPLENLSSSAGSLAVVKVQADLRIRKGDRIGVMAEDFLPASFAQEDSTLPNSCQVGLVPGVYPGDVTDENPNYGACGNLMLVNAKVVRPG